MIGFAIYVLIYCLELLLKGLVIIYIPIYLFS